jgi:hypothetical protein
MDKGQGYHAMMNSILPNEFTTQISEKSLPQRCALKDTAARLADTQVVQLVGWCRIIRIEGAQSYELWIRRRSIKELTKAQIVFPDRARALRGTMLRLACPQLLYGGYMLLTSTHCWAESPLQFRVLGNLAKSKTKSTCRARMLHPFILLLSKSSLHP